MADTAAARSMLKTGLAEKHLPMLDGLRAIAVFLVILNHAGTPAPGGLGVLIFFVISGFLITWLLLNEDAAYGRISLSNFYYRRVLRIFPAFYVYAAIAIGAMLLYKGHFLWSQAIAALAYVNDYYQAIHGDPGTVLSHTWSLAVEEQFYLTWPALFIALRKNPRNFARVLAGLIMVEWVYRAVLQFAFHMNQGWFYEAFDTRIDQLLVGCLLAVVLFHWRDQAILGRYCSNGWLLVAAAGALVASAIIEARLGAGYRDSIGFLVDPLLVAVLIPTLIAQRNTPFASWLSAPPIRYLGRISYSLYLYQQLIANPVARHLEPLPLGVRLVLSCGAVVVAASLSYKLIEQPFLRLKGRLSRSRAAETQLQAVEA